MAKGQPTAWMPMVATAVCLVAQGCLISESEGTMYLEQDGSVSWVVVERDIRSVAEDPADRRLEEQAFLDNLALGQHEKGKEMAELGAWSVDSRLVREERPFMVVTTGRFASIDEVLQRWLESAGVENEARLEWTLEATRLTWEIRLDPEDFEQINTAGEDLDPLVRIVLLEGEFDDAEGFEVGENGSAATLTAEALEPEDGIATLSLAWKPES